MAKYEIWVQFNHCETCKCGTWLSFTQEEFDRLPDKKKRVYLKDGKRYHNPAPSADLEFEIPWYIDTGKE